MLQRDRQIARLVKKGTIVDRAVVEATARIMGEYSAASKALQDADTHDGEVRFWFVPEDHVIVVEKR